MKRTSLFLALAVLVSVFFGLNLASVRAQTASSGSVTGQVLDPQGAIVAGGAGTLTQTATQRAVKTTTHNAGRFKFSGVNPCVYDLVVTRQGFKTPNFSTQKG